MTIKRSTTNEYPTRYAAFDRDSEIVVYNGDFHEPYELAVYNHAMRNAEYPTITDGVYCEIRRLPPLNAKRGKWGIPRVYVDCHATRPTAAREQRAWSDVFNASLGSTDGTIIPAADIERAIEIAEGFIAEAAAFVEVKE